jgi:hypothetical protein
MPRVIKTTLPNLKAIRKTRIKLVALMFPTSFKIKSVNDILLRSE